MQAFGVLHNTIELINIIFYTNYNNFKIVNRRDATAILVNFINYCNQKMRYTNQSYITG